MECLFVPIWRIVVTYWPSCLGSCLHQWRGNHISVSLQPRVLYYLYFISMSSRTRRYIRYDRWWWCHEPNFLQGHNSTKFIQVNLPDRKASPVLLRWEVCRVYRWYAKLGYATPRNATLRNAMLRYAMLCYAMLCYLRYAVGKDLKGTFTREHESITVWLPLKAWLSMDAVTQ